MTSYPCNKYEQITTSYLLSVKVRMNPCQFVKANLSQGILKPKVAVDSRLSFDEYQPMHHMLS